MARTVLSAYAAAGRRTRTHTAIRWWTCPFAAVASLLPADAEILDLGCGHGHFSMYLAMSSPRRRVLGVDIDGGKIEIGTSVITRAGLGGRVELQAVEPDWRPAPESFDAVVTNDVLYLMGRSVAADVLTSMAASIRPGGVVVVKEMGATPAWKHRVNAVQEHLATQVLRITAGDELAVLTEAEIEAPLQAAGLTVRRERMDRGYPHAHLAVVAARG